MKAIKKINKCIYCFSFKKTNDKKNIMILESQCNSFVFVRTHSVFGFNLDLVTKHKIIFVPQINSINIKPNNIYDFFKFYIKNHE